MEKLSGRYKFGSCNNYLIILKNVENEIYLSPLIIFFFLGIRRFQRGIKQEAYAQKQSSGENKGMSAHSSSEEPKGNITEVSISRIAVGSSNINQFYWTKRRQKLTRGWTGVHSSVLVPLSFSALLNVTLCGIDFSPIQTRPGKTEARVGKGRRT